MREELEAVYESAREWSRAHDYAGHDPFDALNSRLFRSTPFRRSRLARLAWTQALKRSPVCLRRLALVPRGRNSKGTALFALAALSRFRATREADRQREAQEHWREARALLGDLLAARVETESGAAWGYNFDWQGRAFYAPLGTPTLVPTAFAVRALCEACAAFDTDARSAAGGADYLAYTEAALAAREFIVRDLNRSDETEDEVCFSYTPLDRTRVFNASLLAGEALALVGALASNTASFDLALRSARYVVRRQRPDGSWGYGADSYQSWADNFHTAFVLTSLARFLRTAEGSPAARGYTSADGEEIRRAIRRGYEFWRERFFLADGWPKYYHRSAHPADAHSAGAALVACAELIDIEPDAIDLARRVARWSVRELFDRRGFFYYQKRRFHTVRTPFMRWSQGWMMYGLARLLEVSGEQ
ncbi:MAG TPA: hypothetical protein VFA21_04520 [Pyrinomonadaceae bacterium]|jgi:hypothetical protein|nr:hypothetical protein [Pyrinomonadaceae bacterium]